MKGQEAASRVAGYLLHKAGWFLLFAVLLLAAWTGQIPIVTLTSLFLTLALLAKVWSRLSLKLNALEGAASSWYPANGPYAGTSPARSS